MKKVKFKLTPNKLEVINNALGVTITSDGNKNTTALLSIQDELAAKFQKMAISKRDAVAHKPFKASLKGYEAYFFQMILMIALDYVEGNTFAEMAINTTIAEIDPQLL